MVIVYNRRHGNLRRDMDRPSFTIVATVAVALALLFALWPEIRSRFPGQGGRTTRLPPALSLAIALMLPLAAFGLYLHVGTIGPTEITDPRVQQLRNQMVGIAGELERDPDQPELWQRMALIYKDLRHFGSAEHALRRSLYLNPDSVFVRVELAETLHRRSEMPEMPLQARQLLEEALELDPEHIKALWLLGMDNFLVGDYENALARWEAMLPLVPEDSSMYRAVQTETRRARRLLNQQP